MTGLVNFCCSDSVSALASLDSGSVHLVVTSPPYGGLRTYKNNAVWNFEGTAMQLERVVSEGGIVCWNVGDEVIDGCESLDSARQKIFFVDCGFRVHDTMIYEKTNFSNPEKARYHQLFEYVFILSKGKPRCFNPIKDKKNAAAGKPGSLGVNTFTQKDGTKSERPRKTVSEFGMRGNVWKGKTRGQEEMCKKLKHTAMMPKWLARDLILSWSNPGDLVADPFAGSGTTGVAAISTGRRAWLNDVSEESIELSKQECAGAIWDSALG